MYQFYTDLEHKNRMDTKPFLEFDLSSIQEPLVEELQKFTKANFNADTIISRAEELKYTRPSWKSNTSWLRNITPLPKSLCVSVWVELTVDQKLKKELNNSPALPNGLSANLYMSTRHPLIPPNRIMSQ